MKKQYYPLILLFLLIQNAFAQSDDTAIRNRMQEWIKTGQTHFEGRILQVDLYAKRASWGFGQQFYAANVYNPSSYKIRYTGELYAGLICGNEAVSKFDFTLNSNQRMNKAVLGSLNMDFLSDATGLISSADKELCAGDPIMVGGKQYGVNRIKQIGYRNVRAFAIVNGEEIPIDANGILKERRASNPSTNPSASPKTANSASTPSVAQSTAKPTTKPNTTTTRQTAGTATQTSGDGRLQAIQNTTAQNVAVYHANSDSLNASISKFADAVSKVDRTKSLEIGNVNSGVIWLTVSYL